MKVGDLVTMPEESLPDGEEMSVGLIVAPPAVRKNRVGVMWNGEVTIDWEPVSWLEVINESR